MMMVRQLPKFRSAGFSLLEFLLAMGVFSFISLVIAQVFISTLRSNTKTEIIKEVKQNGEFALETMTRLLQSATSIDSACTAGGTGAKSIRFINPDRSMTTLNCALDGSVTRIASRSGGMVDYLTSQNTSLGGTSCAESSLSFRCTDPVGAVPVIRISFQLAQRGTPIDQFETASVSFQTTVTTRNIQVD